MRPTAKLFTERFFWGGAHRHHPYRVRIFFSEQHHRPLAPSLGQRQHLPANWLGGLDQLGHVGADVGQLPAFDRAEVREVEPQPIVVDLRTLLLGMRAQVLLQRVMQNVRRRVGPPDAITPFGVDDCLHLGSLVQHALRQMPRVNHQLAILLGIDNLEFKTFAHDSPLVAHLPTTLAVERGTIEHHAYRLLVADLPHRVAEAILGAAFPQ